PSFPCRRPPGGSTTAGIRRCAPRGWATCTPAGSAPAGRPSPDTEAFERAPSATFRVQEIQMSSLFRAALRASCLAGAAVAVLCFPLPAVADAPAEAEADADPAADPQMTTLEAVRVSGTRDPNEAERALVPGGVSLLDGEAFYQRPVNNMSDALRYVPGLWTESGTGGYAVYFSSRGSNLDATGYDGNGMKLFQDDLPVTTADGNNHNRALDPVAARHVVVARGANALTYGASTLGGAVDFTSPTARNSPGSQLFLAAGSHGLRNAR